MLTNGRYWIKIITQETDKCRAVSAEIRKNIWEDNNMKKLISLLLVLVMIFTMAPAAYAEGTEDISDWDDFWEDFLVYLIRVIAFPEAGEGIFLENGHLSSCSGDDCQCLAVLLATLEEEFAANAEKGLKVWVKSGRDADNVRHDTVVAELEPPYNNDKVAENEAYLESKEAVAKLFADFVDEAEMAKKLYRPSAFLHSQTLNKSVEMVNEYGGQLHVEYLLTTNGEDYFEGYGIGLVEEGSDKGEAKSYIISREPVSAEMPEHDLSLRMGNILIALPESCTNEAFSMGLSFYENGALRIMLVDDAGKAIPGAVISTVLPEGASKAVVVNDSGKFEAIKESAAEAGLVSFTAATGDDVFALTK